MATIYQAINVSATPRIRKALRQSPGMTIQEMAEKLDCKTTIVSSRMYRDLKLGLVKRINHAHGHITWYPADYPITAELLEQDKTPEIREHWPNTLDTLPELSVSAARELLDLPPTPTPELPKPHYGWMFWVSVVLLSALGGYLFGTGGRWLL